MRQKKRQDNGKGDSASAPSRFASLLKGEMQQIFTERHSGKTKQMTNWSVSTFKGKLKFFRLKVVNYKNQTFNRKFDIKPIPILHNISLNAILLSVFRIEFDAQFHRLCYKTIGSCF